MPESPATLMPGVREFLAAAAAADGVALGLLTGNTREGARIKLERFDLNGYFPFGAFGSDSEDRNALVPIALARASVHFGKPVPGGRDVVVLGDTERDIECGKAHGTVTIGVATGGTSAETLARAGADRVFADLSDARAVVECIVRGDGGGGGRG
jgi:phosphoglycolate phosphatase-like HAD superfamily hydrolase